MTAFNWAREEEEQSGEARETTAKSLGRAEVLHAVLSRHAGGRVEEVLAGEASRASGVRVVALYRADVAHVLKGEDASASTRPGEAVGRVANVVIAGLAHAALE